MKTGTVLLLAAGGLIAFHFLGLGVAGNTFQIVFAGVTPNNVFNYTLAFNVQNVSNTLVNLNSLAGTVFLNGQQVGSVSTFIPQGIPGNSQTPVNLTLDLSAFGLGTAVYQLVNTSGSQMNFEVKGNMNVNGMVLPFDVTQSITLP